MNPAPDQGQDQAQNQRNPQDNEVEMTEVIKKKKGPKKRKSEPKKAPQEQF